MEDAKNILSQNDLAYREDSREKEKDWPREYTIRRVKDLLRDDDFIKGWSNIYRRPTQHLVRDKQTDKIIQIQDRKPSMDDFFDKWDIGGMDGWLPVFRLPVSYELILTCRNCHHQEVLGSLKSCCSNPRLRVSNICITLPLGISKPVRDELINQIYSRFEVNELLKSEKFESIPKDYGVYSKRDIERKKHDANCKLAKIKYRNYMNILKKSLSPKEKLREEIEYYNREGYNLIHNNENRFTEQDFSLVLKVDPDSPYKSEVARALAICDVVRLFPDWIDIPTTLNAILYRH